MSPILLALAQLDDPVFLGVVARSLVFAAAGFAALLFGSFWGLHHVLAAGGWSGWLAWAAGLIGGVGAALLALWLFLPVAAVIGAFYAERIAPRSSAAITPPCRPRAAPRSGGSLATRWRSGCACCCSACSPFRSRYCCLVPDGCWRG